MLPSRVTQPQARREASKRRAELTNGMLGSFSCQPRDPCFSVGIDAIHQGWDLRLMPALLWELLLGVLTTVQITGDNRLSWVAYTTCSR